jgi:hypothetical protein
VRVAVVRGSVAIPSSQTAHATRQSTGNKRNRTTASAGYGTPGVAAAAISPVVGGTSAQLHDVVTPRRPADKQTPCFLYVVAVGRPVVFPAIPTLSGDAGAADRISHGQAGASYNGMLTAIFARKGPLPTATTDPVPYPTIRFDPIRASMDTEGVANAFAASPAPHDLEILNEEEGEEEEDDDLVAQELAATRNYNAPLPGEDADATVDDEDEEARDTTLNARAVQALERATYNRRFGRRRKGLDAVQEELSHCVVRLLVNNFGATAENWAVIRKNVDEAFDTDTGLEAGKTPSAAQQLGNKASSKQVPQMTIDSACEFVQSLPQGPNGDCRALAALCSTDFRIVDIADPEQGYAIPATPLAFSSGLLTLVRTVLRFVFHPPYSGNESN